MHWQRKRHRAQQFSSGEDVFHDYRWPLKDAADAAPANGPGGRPRFNWTPRRSRELIRLIIHTDIRFDDIAAAMKDENGNGPSESTCRDHWHEIFGYTPDVARLKNPEGRARRFKEHEKAFKAYCAWIDVRSRSSTIQAERDADLLDDSFGIAPDTEASVPEAQRREADKLKQARSRLNPVLKLKRTIASSQEPSFPTRQTSVPPIDEASADAAPKCPNDVEKKYGLPQGFIPWIKGASISSTESIRRISVNTAHSMRRLSSRVRFDSVANVTSHPANRQQSVLSRGSMLCNYLSSLKPEDDVSASEVENLIRGGQDVNKPNERGETPLHLAVALGSITIVAMLLEHGADPKSETDAGESIWARGRRASVAAIDPKKDDDLEKRRMENQRTICACIEFARSTVRYNPELMTEQKPTKRPRHHFPLTRTSSASSQPAEADALRNVFRGRRPRLETSSSQVQHWPCPEITDDSTTTDSDRQTGSSASPFTPDTTSAVGSSDVDRDDFPPPPPSMILQSHHATRRSHGFLSAGPALPPSFQTYTMADHNALHVTSHPVLTPDYATESQVDPLEYAYDPSTDPSLVVMNEPMKNAHVQTIHNVIMPELSIQSPHGDNMAPNMDLMQHAFNSHSSPHDVHTHQIPPQLSHQHPLDADLKSELDTHDLHNFLSNSTSATVDPVSNDGGMPPITQPGYCDQSIDYHTLMHYHNFDPTTNTPFFEPPRSPSWQPGLPNNSVD